MEKEWWIQIDGKELGPFSIQDLAQDRRITPDTLVRKEGSSVWKRIGDEKELKSLFKDEEEIQPEEEDVVDEPRRGWPSGELAMAEQKDPGNFLLWVVIILLLLIWLLDFFRR